MTISVYGGKNECLKNVLKNFQMSEQYWGCLDKISEVYFSPAETLNFGVLYLKIAIYAAINIKCIPEGSLDSLSLSIALSKLSHSVLFI